MQPVLENDGLIMDGGDDWDAEGQFSCDAQTAEDVSGKIGICPKHPLESQLRALLARLAQMPTCLPPITSCCAAGLFPYAAVQEWTR
eukprot:SAG31_NODE_2376_length_5841_cov_10.199060_3_plen_87_part_00